MSRHVAFAAMFGSAILSQALLSAASFAMGLLLIRSTTDVHYGYYILASNAVLLLVALHGAFVNPALVKRLSTAEGQARNDLVGGLLREQTQVLTLNVALGIVVVSVLWYAEVLDNEISALSVATLISIFAMLRRNFFRMVLLAHKRPHAVLLTDACYGVVLILGTLWAVNTQAPAVVAIVVTAIAAFVSGALTGRLLWRESPWNKRGAKGILRTIAPLAALSTAGAAIHWAFSQGYMYIAAGMLDITAVAAIAATRLLMMPINLLSTGIGALMLPLTSDWLHKQSAMIALRRLALFAAAVVGIALCYFLLLWLARDWLFTHILKKQFEHRDQLLLLWMLAFIPMVVRDQLIYLLVSAERFKRLTQLAFVSAVASLCAGYIGMARFGVVGAPVGVVVGELISLIGVVTMALRFAAPLPEPAMVSEAS